MFTDNNYALAIVYMLRLAVGDFDTDSYATSGQEVYSWILFFLATFVVAIIIMGMLIAIVNDSFEQVYHKSQLAVY